MSEAVYQNITKLCSGVSLPKRTLRFGTAKILSCEVTAVLCLSTDSSFRGYLLPHFDTQKYELLTMSIVGGQTLNCQNPSYIAMWPFGLSTMTIVGGQINKYIHLSCVAGQPFTSQMSICACHEVYIVSLKTAQYKKNVHLYTKYC